MYEFILKTIIESVIIGGVLTGFLKLFFAKKIEDYKTKETIRQKAILIADLLAEWISNPDDRKRLNQLTLEAFIWLPNNIAEKLSELLSHDQNAPDVRQIVAEVRKLILGDDEAIDPKIIIIFPRKTEKE